MRKNLLIIRTDRMGDVMLSLPAVEYVRLTMPDAEIDFLIQELYVDVVGPYLQTRNVNAVPIQKGVNPFAQKKYDAVLILFADAKLAFKAWSAQIPKRIGLFSKPWSFMLLSDGLRQERSKAEKNEALYNLDLAKLFVSKLTGEKRVAAIPMIKLTGDERSERKARYRLEDVGIDPDKPFILFHPGMGGSALNVSSANYLKLIAEFEKTTGLQVVVSIGPLKRDQELASTVLSARPDLKVIRHVSLPVLREIFRIADTVVAPSTGPLHLAHYVGTKTVGIYPPVKSQCKERWAPWGGAGYSRVYSPEFDCPGKRDCIGAECQHYLCMDKIDWADRVMV